MPSVFFRRSASLHLAKQLKTPRRHAAQQRAEECKKATRRQQNTLRLS